MECSVYIEGPPQKAGPTKSLSGAASLTTVNWRSD